MKHTNIEQVKTLIRYYQRKRLGDTRENSEGGYSISGLFKFLRKQPQLNALGDYPLLRAIVDCGKGKLPQDLRRKLFYTITYSPELNAFSKGQKQELVEQLMEGVK